jgi:hypothetical protein
MEHVKIKALALLRPAQYYKLPNVSQQQKGALEVRCLSLWEFCEWNVEGRPPFWGPCWIGRKGSGDGCIFSWCPQLGNLEGGSSTGGFIERWMKGAVGMERLSLKRLSAEGLWGRAPLLGTLKDMLRFCFHRGPTFGEHGGTLFIGLMR